MPARIGVVFTLVSLGVLIGPVQPMRRSHRKFNHSGQTRGVDVKAQKFRPVISPDMTAVDASGAAVKSEAAIAPSTVRQMTSLLQDKQSRTAAHKKIRSKLIYTARMLPGVAGSGRTCPSKLPSDRELNRVISSGRVVGTTAPPA